MMSHGRRPRSWPIQWKLVAVIVSVTAVSLLLACAGMILDDRVTFERGLIEDASILAEVVGDHSRPALARGDQNAARRELSALRADRHIRAAAIYDAQGRLFAAYSREDRPATFPDRVDLVEGQRFNEGVLVLGQRIESGASEAGFVLIRADTSAWRAGVWRFLRVALVLFLAILVVSVVLAIRLQRLFTGPIAALLRTTEEVSRDRNYGLRAAKAGDDELGVLVDGFNHMLAEIEQRDQALQLARDELAAHLSELHQEVGERRRVQEELAEINVMLQREVLERQQTEAALARHAEALRHSNAELEQFAYVASHDLQEPLRGISGCLQLLTRRYHGRLDDKADKLIEFAVSGAARLKTLIDDLLAYSRLDKHREPFGLVDCNEVRAQVLANLALSIDECRAHIVCDPLPSLVADSMQLPLLFQNLVSNALKFRGERRPEVRIGAERGDGEWVFHVRDNGIGMDPRFLERIFVIFQRLHTRDEYAGTGMGLAISKKIVERHRGRIWAESTPGQGTTFFFTIPDDAEASHGESRRD